MILIFFSLLNMESLALFSAGLIPAIIIGILGYRYLSRRSRLPASKAILAVMLGIVSALPAYYIQSWSDRVFEVDTTSWWQAMILAFLIVALIEEGFKAAMLWVSHVIVPVDEALDLMVVSLLIAMGFAGVENILYSYSKGWEVALFRSITAVPAHACFAIVMAYFVGMDFPNRKEITPYLQGLLLAWILHGLYDFFIVQDMAEGLMIGALVMLVICALLAYRAYVRVKGQHDEGQQIS
jgi:RsiW-degrading membrane proteinase PrsW (M82 family)